MFSHANTSSLNDCAAIDLGCSYCYRVLDSHLEKQAAPLLGKAAHRSIWVSGSRELMFLFTCHSPGIPHAADYCLCHYGRPLTSWLWPLVIALDERCLCWYPLMVLIPHSQVAYLWLGGEVYVCIGLRKAKLYLHPTRSLNDTLHPLFMLCWAYIHRPNIMALAALTWMALHHEIEPSPVASCVSCSRRLCVIFMSGSC